jgi:hypothetical protein
LTGAIFFESIYNIMLNKSLFVLGITISSLVFQSCASHSLESTAEKISTLGRLQVAEVKGSLNAADVAQEVTHIPQVHYVGGKDKIVGNYIAESFLSRASWGDCITIQTVPGVTYSQGWEQAWPQLISTDIPNC